MCSDSIDCVKKNLDDLFSKAEHIDRDELDVKFKELVGKGEKSVELSGKLFYEYLWKLNF